MHVCKAHGVRQDRGVLGSWLSALVAVAGEGPEGRRVSGLVRAASFDTAGVGVLFLYATGTSLTSCIVLGLDVMVQLVN